MNRQVKGHKDYFPLLLAVMGKYVNDVSLSFKSSFVECMCLLEAVCMYLCM